MLQLENLTPSKELMKRQYDKKINPITFNVLKETDEVLIENVYQKKKGGKFHDKWLGPYPIADVTRNTVKVHRNKSLQRVKRFKVKLLKRPSTTNSTDQKERPSKCQRLAVDIVKSTIESLQIKDSPPIGAEETVFATSLPESSHQEMINKLTSMKSQIMLSDLHRELNLRRDMKFIDLFNWNV